MKIEHISFSAAKALVPFVMFLLNIQMSAQTTLVSTQENKGQQPPKWIKNKVTQAQFDTLATVQQVYDVDYAFLKQRRLSKQDISRWVHGAYIKLNDDKMKVVTGQGGKAIIGYTTDEKKVAPIGSTCCKQDGAKMMIFPVYSSLDGYDAHVVIVMTRKPADKNKEPATQPVTIEGYSLSSLPVEVKDARIEKIEKTPNGSKTVNVKEITIGKGGTSETYTVSGTLKFEDAKGYSHTEPFIQAIQLKLF